MKVSIVSLIYQSTDFAEFVYNSIMKYTPEIEQGEAEFFFVANDATDEVINFLKEKNYPHYVSNNPHYSESELFERGYARPEYISRVYMGYNYGIKMCKNPLVVLINSDMAFSPNWLSNLKAKLTENTVVSPVVMQPAWFLNPRNGIKGIKQSFGATIRSFNEKNFLKTVEKMSEDSVSEGVQFMPMLMYKEHAEKVGYYPEGNLHGGSYDKVRMPGDAFFYDKLQGIGVKHVRVNNSFVYHLNEGEKNLRIDNSTFILGANGMLGKYLVKYLKDSIPITREYIDATQVKKDSFQGMMETFNPQKGDTIINAIGITNKKTLISSWEFILVNSIFPRVLADYCEKNGINLIHISTDAVFTGLDGNYNEDSLPDANDIYGFSKACGEPNNCTVIRTSIIGENIRNTEGLLEWVRKNEEKEITGWTNHLWNGVTCLQLAKICEEIIKGDRYWRGVRHIFSPEKVSKATLVELINKAYELNKVVNGVEAPKFCDRTLTTLWNIGFSIPPIADQIIEQKNFLI
jgi:dTDP-4-dehydrorhamnose reductase